MAIDSLGIHYQTGRWFLRFGHRSLIYRQVQLFRLALNLFHLRQGRQGYHRLPKL